MSQIIVFTTDVSFGELAKYDAIISKLKKICAQNYSAKNSKEILNAKIQFEISELGEISKITAKLSLHHKIILDLNKKKAEIFVMIEPLDYNDESYHFLKTAIVRFEPNNQSISILNKQICDDIKQTNRAKFYARYSMRLAETIAKELRDEFPL